MSVLLMVSPLSSAEESEYQSMYFKLCGVCHGNQGDGRGRAGASLSPAPTDFTSEAVRARLTRERMVVVVRDGIPGTSMVGYGKRLSENELGGLVDYVRSQFMVSIQDKKVLAVSSGRSIYIEHCSACHGDNGNTAVWAKNGLDPAPRNFTAPEAVKELSRERMITSVTHGRPGTAMMSFRKRLTPDQIEQVVNYVRSEFMQVADTSRISHYPGNITPDVTGGKAFYMGNCFTCHGKNGDGTGPRAHFNFPRPRDFTSEDTAASFDRAALFNAIKKGKAGTVMPAWETVLSDQQVADVAEFVYQSFVNPEKKSLP